jgi:hypothetical protein
MRPFALQVLRACAGTRLSDTTRVAATALETAHPGHLWIAPLRAASVGWGTSEVAFAGWRSRLVVERLVDQIARSPPNVFAFLLRGLVADPRP